MRRTLVVLSLTGLLIAASALAQSRAAAQDPRVAVPPTTIADTLPPPPGAPNLAWLSALEVDMGKVAPADSLRRAFMASFRGAFAEGAYATERERDGVPLASLPLSARFRLIEGTGGWGAWGMHVKLSLKTAADLCRLPAEAAASAITVAVEVTAGDAEAGKRPVAAIVRVALGNPVHCANGAPLPGQRDLTLEWWRELGRTTGLLALEQLHRLSGDLDADTRFALGPAERLAPAPLPAPAPPAKAPPRKR